MTAFGNTWMTITQSFATIALILTGIGLMLGIVKPAEALKYVGAILGTAIMVILIPGALANLWSAISLWRWIGLAVIGIVVLQWRRPRRDSGKR